MTATIVRLLPTAEQALLKCYVDGNSEPDAFDDFYEALEVPYDATPPRLAVAVAQILLHHVQGTLPQRASVQELNRKAHKRHSEARLNFSPRHVCTINWADSGPGVSWPEAYYVTYLPGFDKFVITASRDGPETWGCCDHAIGVADGDLEPIEAAKASIIAFWRSQFDGWDQARWVDVLDDGLSDHNEANAWADEVWSRVKS